MRQREELLDLLKHAGHLDRISPTRFELNFPFNAPYEDQVISSDELSVLDERLTPYLNHYFDTAHYKGFSNKLLASTVVDTLSLWDDKFLKLEDSKCYKHLAKIVLGIEWDEMFHFIKWSFTSVQTRTFAWDDNFDRKPLTYVTGNFYHSIEASEEWMDTAFPDWRKRWDLAKSLDLNEADFIEFFLAKNEKDRPSIILPESNFE